MNAARELLSMLRTAEEQDVLLLNREGQREAIRILATLLESDAAFVVGQRVRHRYADLAGKVERVSGEYVRVRWDHPGLAFSALGSMADLQRADYLEPEVD